MTSQRRWGYNQHPRWLGPINSTRANPRDAPLHRCIPLLFFNGSDYGFRATVLSMKMKIVFI